LPSNNELIEIVSFWEKLILSVRTYILTGSSQDWKKVEESIKEFENSVSKASELFDKYPSISEIKPIFESFRNSYSEYVKIVYDNHDCWEKMNSSVLSFQNESEQCITSFGRLLNSLKSEIHSTLNSNLSLSLIQERINHLSDVSYITEQLNQIIQAFYHALNKRDYSSFKESIKNLEKIKQKVQHLKNSLNNDTLLQMLVQSEKNINELDNNSKLFVENYEKLKNTSEIRAKFYNQTSQELKTLLQKNGFFILTRAEGIVTQLSTTSQFAFWGMLIALVLGILISLWIIRSIESVL
ncbi:MAG: hypothetical protein N2035_10555, partial [Chthoniobacterales bacterium]|nr:hypothetical protein [Chthoniobacterales bacterium]